MSKKCNIDLDPVDEARKLVSDNSEQLEELFGKDGIIKAARAIMSDAFYKSSDFRHSYLSNIAMCIYDRSEILSLEWCNKIADEIIKVVFER